MSDLIVFQPPGRPWGMPNLSPFCTKLETYLRMAEVPHTMGAADFRKAPKGKIPFVSLDGKLVGDSQLIINELEKRAGARALDHGLSPRDAALGHAIRRMLEEGLYFVGVHFRWIDDAGWAVFGPELRKSVPGPIKLLMGVIRRGQRKKLVAQGTGRHQEDEILALGIADLDALAELLGDQPYLLGDRPRTADCTVYALLEAQLGFPHESRIRAHLETRANLVAYRQRIRDRWFADLAPATAAPAA